MSTRAAAVALAALLSLGPARAVAQNGTEKDLTVYGHADYDWTIRPLDGDPVELEAFRGNVLFINLWASWCTPCVREMETIERLVARLADTDVRFLIVAAEGERAVRRHLRRHPYELPIYLEVDPIPREFGLRGLPTSWVVDRDGRILVLHHGEAVWDTDDVERFVRAVLVRRALPAATPTPIRQAPATARTTRPAWPG
ncbi:MAG: TlpA disulfide reductase family protein [Gemmatimonadota bacterium]|nr:TlpA disulfide reductase family protein [Gemmatimonadota bacterium]